VQGYQVNEYGSTASEQQAGPSAWDLGRFEHLGIDGLRANWGMEGGLYMGMGDLVTGSNQTTASWWVYIRCADMTGRQVNVTAGSKIDGVAAIDSEVAKAIIVLGSRVGVTGAVIVNLNGIPTYLLNNNSMNVLVERMPAGGGYVSAPTFVSDQEMTIVQ
jgi:hypothetical protein